MTFINDANAVRLTQADWEEIAGALESKIRAIAHGDLGEEEPGPASDAAWIHHLRLIGQKIGQDGSLALEGGVLPDPGTQW